MNIENIKKIKAEIDDLQKTYANKSKELLLESFKEFFKEVPEIWGFSWVQWVPGFNDGEACTFSFCPPSFFKSEEEYAECESYSEELNPFRKPSAYVYANQAKEGYYREEIKAYDELCASLGENRITSIQKSIEELHEIFKIIDEGTLETLFGTNARIWVTSNGINTDDYDCGC